MSQQCMRALFHLCDIVSLSGRPIIGQLGIAITDPSVADTGKLSYYVDRYNSSLRRCVARGMLSRIFPVGEFA
jgi:hypothetical protein